MNLNANTDRTALVSGFKLAASILVAALVAALWPQGVAAVESLNALQASAGIFDHAPMLSSAFLMNLALAGFLLCATAVVALRVRELRGGGATAMPRRTEETDREAASDRAEGTRREAAPTCAKRTDQGATPGRIERVNRWTAPSLVEKPNREALPNRAEKPLRGAIARIERADNTTMSTLIEEVSSLAFMLGAALCAGSICLATRLSAPMLLAGFVGLSASPAALQLVYIGFTLAAFALIGKLIGERRSMTAAILLCLSPVFCLVSDIILVAVLVIAAARFVLHFFRP